MIEHSKHIVFDEIYYDRLELSNFVTQFESCIVNYADWQKSTNGKQSYEIPNGYNVVDTKLLDGKIPTDYPEIKKLVDLFKIPIQENHVLISHYDVGFKLRPHTDHGCKVSIMFPIHPEDSGAELVFHDVNCDYVPGTAFDQYLDKVDYKVKYSTEHPTAFSTQVPHSVEQVEEERIYLKFMLFDTTFDELKDLCKQGRLF